MFMVDTEWIHVISYFGVLVSLFDLLTSLKGNNNRINMARGILLIILIIVVIFGAILFADTLEVGGKFSDICTILSLLISLPKELYCYIIRG